MKRSALFLLLLLIALLVVPITAQDSAQDEVEDAVDPTMEMMNTVIAALDDMAELQAYRVDGRLTIDQTIGTGGTSVRTRFSQDLDMRVAYNGEGLEKMRAELEQTVNLGLGIGSGSFRLELLLPSADDARFYGRLSNFAGLMLDLSGDQWVILGSEASEADFLNEAFPDPETLVTSFSRVIDYPVDETTVLAVRERRAQNIRYERAQFDTRRIEIEFDLNALREMGALSSALRAVDAPALGLTSSQLIDALMDGAKLVINFYIDTENDMIRRIETELTYDTTFIAQGEEVRLQQTVEGRFTYTGFDQDFEVVTPAEFID